MPNPGLSPEVQEALQRRGMGAGALTQVSPQAAMQQPLPSPATPSSLTQASAPQAPKMTKGGKQEWQPQTQEDFIIKTLAEQLKNVGKAKKEQAELQPMGGGYGGDPAEVVGGGSDMFMPPKENANKRDFFTMGSPSMAKSQMQGQYAF